MLGEISRKLSINYSCTSGGGVFIRHLTVADSCAMIEVGFIFL